MVRIRVLFLIAMLYSPVIWSQCAPGIPSAGNPGCIPPSQPNSPYAQGTNSPPERTESAPVWESRWGAVAMDKTSARGGTVEGRSSKSDASQIALDLCRKNGGKDCSLLLAFHDQCAALAQAPNGGAINWITATSTSEAERKALNECDGGNQCDIIYSKCSMPERRR